MTATQVNYWSYQEQKRHNLVTEDVSKGTLAVEKGTLAETIRHNKKTESLTSRDIGEKTRHNKATEKLTATDIGEKIRHNKATEKLTATQIGEYKRHNIATEQLTASDIAVKRRQADISQQQADTAYLNAQTRVQELWNQMKRYEAQNDLDKAKAKGQEIKNIVDTVAGGADILKRYADAANSLIAPLKSIFGGLVAKSGG